MKVEEMTPEEMREALRITREVAIRVARERGWCTDGLNDALEEIGLNPVGTGATSVLVLRIPVEHESGERPDLGSRVLPLFRYWLHGVKVAEDEWSFDSGEITGNWQS